MQLSKTCELVSITTCTQKSSSVMPESILSPNANLGDLLYLFALLVLEL